MLTGDVCSFQNKIRQFNFQGFPIHTRTFGVATNKPPLVFVGGAFQNIANVVPLCEAIAEDNQVIAIDTPGNGMTGVLPETYSFEFICDAINHALVSQDIGVINLFGCSYGSIVALRYCQRYDTVNKIVVASAMEKLPDELRYEFNKLLLMLDWNRTEEFATAFTNLMTNPELRKINRLAKLAAAKLHNALMNATTCINEQFKHNTRRILRDGMTDLSQLPDINATVIVGEMDHFVPVSANKRVADAFQRSELITIPKSDHMVHVEQRKTFVKAILESLDDNYPFLQAA